MALRNTIDAPLDLGSLSASDGKPLDIPLDDIAEDPNQPRKDFDSGELQELAEDIGYRGVISPISVRPNPAGSPQYIINFGARRYRASQIAGKRTIPGFVNEQLDDYAQVVENEQRSNLRPIDFAEFINRKVQAGESRAEIARRLGKPKSVVTFHLALIDMPEQISTAFHGKRISDPRAVYELRKLAKAHPVEVERFCIEQDPINASMVMKLAKVLSKPVERKPPQPANTDEPTNPLPAPAMSPAQPKPMEKPRMVVSIDSREADVCFEFSPTSPTQMLVRYRDDDTTEEVACARCTVVSLYESEA